MSRATSWCPAAVMRSASVSPDRSSAGVRESDTVRTAIRSGWNARLVSIRVGNGFGPGLFVRHPDRGRHVRPAVLGQRLERGAGLAEAGLVGPQIAQHLLDVAAGL